MSNLVDEWFIAHAANDATIWQWRDGRLSFGDAANRCRRLAQHFHDQGLRPRQRVLLSQQDGPEFAVALMALLWLGAIPVVISPYLPLGEIQQDAKRADCIWAVIDFDIAGSVPMLDQTSGDKEVLVKPWCYEPTHELMLQGSSGSTGRNKLAVYDYHGLMHMQLGWQYLNLEPGSRLYSSMRMTFGFGMQMSVLAPWIFGSTHVIDRGTMSIRSIPEIVETFKITHLILLPSVLKALLRHNRRFGHKLKWLGVGSEPLDLATAELCSQQLGRRVINQYGCTEHMGVLFVNDRPEWCPTAIGRPNDQILEIKLVDQHGVKVNQGEPGQMWLRVASHAVNFLGDPETTEYAFRSGWLVTRDIVRHNIDDSYTLIGRDDSNVKIGGQWINIHDVEQVIESLSGVSECITIIHQNCLKSFIVLASTAELHRHDVVHHIYQNTHNPHMIPSDIFFVADLPITATMKRTRNVNAFLHLLEP